MDRRKALSLGGAGMLSLFSTAGWGMKMPSSFEADGCRFEWWRSGGMVKCTLVAPAPGWVAVGFGPNEYLPGTRFLMIDAHAAPNRFEEHVATGSAHSSIDDLGVAACFSAFSAGKANGEVWASLSIPQKVEGAFPLSLDSNKTVNLMLAWSNSTDFSHHSAWRRHFQIKI